MFKSILIGICFLALLGLGYWWWSKNKAINSSEIQDRQRIPVVINQHTLIVEVVTSPESITLGLGDRTEIGADGMLFIFPEAHKPNFWMKGMQFDLDLVWLLDNKVVGVTANVPALPLDTPPSQLPLYQPPGVVDMVLEIPAGRAAELGIVNGAILELK